MKPVFVFLALFVACSISAQYRFDNVKFTTVYWDGLCQSLQQYPGYLLLDVRSKGEYSDTSSYKSLNIGHLKGATNIDINEIRDRLKEIEGYKNKPVFVYCSHSQRSRRVSKMLADSGFAHVFNINGGVSNLRLYGFRESCSLLTSSLPYQILSPIAFANARQTDYFILDVRSDSAYQGIAVQERSNVYGKLKAATHISLELLNQAYTSLPKDKKILIVDETGSDSPAAAELLHQKGFKDLAVLFNGFDAYVTEIPESKRTGWISNVTYHAIGAKEFVALAKTGNLTLLDVRTKEEFGNSAKDSYRNAGYVKTAINIPYTEWDKEANSLHANKEQPVVVYAFSNQAEVYEAAKKLAALGYKNVNVLMGGLFSFRWRAANIKGEEYLKDWVVNVPSDNQ